MQRIEIGRIRPGVYEYLGQNGGGTLYRVLGFVRHAQHHDTRTGYQLLVEYEGLDGRDRGVKWVDTLAGFVLRFRAVENQPEPVSVGKVLDFSDKGSGP